MYEHGDLSSNPTQDFTFQIPIIILRKVGIQLFFLQAWGNCWADWALSPRYDNQSTARKTLNSNLLNIAEKIDLG